MERKWLFYVLTFIESLRIRGDHLELSYLDLLSPEPVYFHNIGGVISPTLKEIRSIGYDNYQLYLNLFLMTPKSFYETIQQSEYYDSLSVEQQAALSIFDLMTEHDSFRTMLENALNFFMKEQVHYHAEIHAFYTYEKDEDKNTDKNPVGMIHKNIWPALCKIVLQRNNMKPPKNDITQAKNQRALAIMKKLQEGRDKQNIKNKSDKNMELGNIISAIANRHESLNILNIWDLTIYQLWDSFHRLCNNNILDIQSMSVAAWGDKEKRFDSAGWFKNITEN